MIETVRRRVIKHAWAACGLVSVASVFTACGQKEFPPWEFETPSMGGQPTLGPDVDGPIVVTRPEGGDGDGDTSGPVEPTLDLCETQAGYSASSLDGASLLDDFEDGDASFADNGRVGTWYTYGDDTGNQLPGSGASIVDSPGRAGSAYALHAGGVAHTEWGSGMGAALAENVCLHDLSVYTGISFWARGKVVAASDADVVDRDYEAVKLLLTEVDVVPEQSGGGCGENSGSCWDSHKARFSLGSCWERYSFDFSEFEQDGWGRDGGDLDLDKLYNIGFEIASKNDWEIWLDDVEFYVGDKPASEEDCELGDGHGGGSGFF